MSEHVHVSCVWSCLSLCIKIVNVRPSRCAYKYIFCTRCTKGLGLARSTIRSALFLSVSVLQTCPPQSIDSCFAAPRLGQLYGSLHFHYISSRGFPAADWLIDCSQLIEMKTVAPHLWQNPCLLFPEIHSMQSSCMCYHFTTIIVIKENNWQI